jgi:methyltransferase (TIGR00027 family)
MSTPTTTPHSTPLTAIIGLFLSPIILIIYIIKRIVYFTIPTSRPSFTAELACSLRSISTGLGLLQDDFAWEFLLDWDTKFFVWLSITTRLALGWSIGRGTAIMTARTITFDQAILEVSPKQLVILGAGYDSRSFRLPLSVGETKVFEIDTLITQQAKKKALQKVKVNNPKLFWVRDISSVEFIDVDFTTTTPNNNHSFMDKLQNKGFLVTENQTIFILEGVASYLTYEQLITMFKTISSHCTPGTRLVFNCHRKRKSKIDKLFLRVLQMIGEPAKFQLGINDDIEILFGKSANIGFEIEKIQEFSDLIPRLVPGYDVNNKKKIQQYGTMITLKVC